MPDIVDRELAVLVRERLDTRRPRRLPERFVPPAQRPHRYRWAVALVAAFLLGLSIAVLVRPEVGRTLLSGVLGRPVATPSAPAPTAAPHRTPGAGPASGATPAASPGATPAPEPGSPAPGGAAGGALPTVPPAGGGTVQLPLPPLPLPTPSGGVPIPVPSLPVPTPSLPPLP